MGPYGWLLIIGFTIVGASYLLLTRRSRAAARRREGRMPQHPGMSLRHRMEMYPYEGGVVCECECGEMREAFARHERDPRLEEAFERHVEIMERGGW